MTRQGRARHGLAGQGEARRGMAVTVGRIREDSVLDYKFVALSHNTLRGAAGGGVLLAELLCAKGYVKT